MTAPGEPGEQSEGGSWSIRETADAFGVSLRTLRHYDGLLRPRMERGQRRYDTRCRLRLMLVLKGKQLGFSLREMAAFMARDAAQRGCASGLVDKQELAQHIARLETQRSRLDATIEDLRRALRDQSETDENTRH